MEPYTTLKLSYSWSTNRISHLRVPKKERTGERARSEITRYIPIVRITIKVPGSRDLSRRTHQKFFFPSTRLQSLASSRLYSRQLSTLRPAFRVLRWLVSLPLSRRYASCDNDYFLQAITWYPKNETKSEYEARLKRVCTFRYVCLRPKRRQRDFQEICNVVVDRCNEHRSISLSI